jgi:hypothetical protein
MFHISYTYENSVKLQVYTNLFNVWPILCIFKIYVFIYEFVHLSSSRESYQ